jgi:hypothetical protein
MANYTNISATANIKPMAGKLKGIFVSAASSTPTITVYDSAATSTSQPTMLSTFTPAAATSYLLPLDGAYAKNGIYVVIGGTVTATVIYE